MDTKISEIEFWKGTFKKTSKNTIDFTIDFIGNKAKDKTKQ
jgi:hypothetical protein